MNIYRGRACKEYSLTASLYDCIEDNNLRGVKHMLIEKGANPNIIIKDTGLSPFHLVIGNESEDFTLQATKLILQCGGNPNIQSEDGLTPLHIASAWGRPKIVELLIHFGANYEIRDVNYQTALDYAIEHGYNEIAKFLLDAYKTNSTTDHLEETKTYLLSLDKVLVNDGISEAEYEVERIGNLSNSCNLQLLPETNSYEYVSNWCSLHAKSRQNSLESENGKFKENHAILNEFNCSSNNKQSQSKTSDNINYNTRKNNHNVIENISLEYECSTKFRTNKNFFSNKSDSIINTRQDFGRFKESSRESGILTISSSSSDSITSSDKFNEEKMLGVSNFAPRIACNKDTSSDYFTCNEISGSTNILERNIIDITSDCSILPEEKINNNTCDNCAENNDIVNVNELNNLNLNLNHDASCVNIAEIYKYTDTKEGITLLEKRFLVKQNNNSENDSFSQSSKLSLPASFDYDSDTLRLELTQFGFPAGPITKTTKRVYLRKLYKLQKQSFKTGGLIPVLKKEYSLELENTLQTPSSIKDSLIYKGLEETLYKEFNNADASRKWREGLNKSSFSYLLLDPRLTQNLPNRAEQVPLTETWKIFLDSIFYIGKGKRSRPYSHLYEGVALWQSAVKKTTNKKLQHILDIWNDNYGVVCLHVFQNVIPVEAYTREAAMIKALKLENLRNNIAGQFYGTSLTWSSHQQKLLGVLLLYKSMLIFLNEGERQLRPSDIN